MSDKHLSTKSTDRTTVGSTGASAGASQDVSGSSSTGSGSVPNRRGWENRAPSQAAATPATTGASHHTSTPTPPVQSAPSTDSSSAPSTDATDESVTAKRHFTEEFEEYLGTFRIAPRPSEWKRVAGPEPQSKGRLRSMWSNDDNNTLDQDLKDSAYTSEQKAAGKAKRKQSQKRGTYLVSREDARRQEPVPGLCESFISIVGTLFAALSVAVSHKVRCAISRPAQDLLVYLRFLSRFNSYSDLRRATCTFPDRQVTRENIQAIVSDCITRGAEHDPRGRQLALVARALRYARDAPNIFPIAITGLSRTEIHMASMNAEERVQARLMAEKKRQEAELAAKQKLELDLGQLKKRLEIDLEKRAMEVAADRLQGSLVDEWDSIHFNQLTVRDLDAAYASFAMPEYAVDAVQVRLFLTEAYQSLEKRIRVAALLSSKMGAQLPSKGESSADAARGSASTDEDDDEDTKEVNKLISIRDKFELNSLEWHRANYDVLQLCYEIAEDRLENADDTNREELEMALCIAIDEYDNATADLFDRLNELGIDSCVEFDAESAEAVVESAEPVVAAASVAVAAEPVVAAASVAVAVEPVVAAASVAVAVEPVVAAASVAVAVEPAVPVVPAAAPVFKSRFDLEMEKLKEMFGDM